MKKIMIILILGLLVLSGCSNEEINNEETFKEFTMMAQEWEFVPNEIEVNQGDSVRLIITSIDVEHGFYLPEYGINANLPVYEDVVVEFVADEKGSFEFSCSVYCGEGHGSMDGKLIVN
ncbi:lipoprotein [archaeon]|jgi:cytochrome c oxidase subunit II|nr:lipoprotein [archaeon]MBT3731315.1 lipoprotein [archaeon]MBT4669968.1 lipoprotein [archaeon]MBT5029793.1 lipoprotein [archaeon]MBT7052623.1 lipoprotein [archaeon]